MESSVGVVPMCPGQRPPIRFAEVRRVGFEGGGIEPGVERAYHAETPPQDSPLTLLRIDPLQSAGDLRIDAVRLLK